MKKVEFVCLANSRKMSGSCIAGKIVGTNQWIRLVTPREYKEISFKEQRYMSGQFPKVLDIIEVLLKEHQPILFQKENYLIDNRYSWKKKGDFSGDLDTLLDSPTDLWGIGSSTYYGLNDRFEDHISPFFKNSLYFIKPKGIRIIVSKEERRADNPKRKVRAEFQYNGIIYIFPITDPRIENMYLRGKDGIFDLKKNNIFFCVSIGLPYKGFCYKFIASLIETK